MIQASRLARALRHKLFVPGVVLGLVIANLAGEPVTAGALELDGTFAQGGMVLGQTVPGTELHLGSVRVAVSQSGEFVFGFGRDAPDTVTLDAVYPDQTTERRVLNIRQRAYAIQRVDGLPQRTVTPPPEALERIRRENLLIAAVRARNTDNDWYRQGFDWPTHGPITGVYGSQRILNGEPRRPHFGLDIAPPEGTPVMAPAAGVIRLAAPDLYFTGGTVMIDHGRGISSVLMHLKDVTVQEGDVVQQGDQIGTVGKTGRASGPHLDWRVNWFEVRLDPQFLLENRPDKP